MVQNLACMNSLKHKLSGLPAFRQPLLPDHNRALLSEEKRERNVSENEFRFDQLPIDKHSTAFNAAHMNNLHVLNPHTDRPSEKAERYRSRSNDRDKIRNFIHNQSRSLERYDSREYNSDRLLSGYGSIEKMSHCDGQFESMHVEIGLKSCASGNLNSKHFQALPFSCCESYTHKAQCTRRDGEDNRIQYSCCQSYQHRSGCQVDKPISKPLQFVQDYVNQNSFGHISRDATNLIVPEKSSTANLLDDIQPVRFTPRSDEANKFLVNKDYPRMESNDGTFAQNQPKTKTNPDYVTRKKLSANQNCSSQISLPSDRKAETSGSLSQQCPPLCTTRLKPCRILTKAAVLHLLEGGEVCVEFIKKRNNKELVMDACRISQDGMSVVLYSISDGNGGPVTEFPYSIPVSGADAFYSYETLPSNFWKNYVYASKFVNVIKSKTPKITCYTDQAKCFLMENSPNPDFEAKFYNTGKTFKYVHFQKG